MKGKIKKPEAYCATIMKNTEKHCAKKKSMTINFLTGLAKVSTRSDGRIGVLGTASDNKPDMYSSRMDIELYENFLTHWKDLEIDLLLDVAHYEHGVVGKIEDAWIDGRYLKFKGFLDDSPMARELSKGLLDKEKVKSIAFSIQFIPIDWYIDSEHYSMIVYTDGIWERTAFTTIPANPRSKLIEVLMRARTKYDDAKELIGPRMAQWLEDQEQKNMSLDLQNRAYTPEFLEAVYGYLKSSGKVDKEVWEAAMKWARGHAGGKISPKKKDEEAQEIDISSLLKLVTIPITKLSNTELLEAHESLHQVTQ